MVSLFSVHVVAVGMNVVVNAGDVNTAATDAVSDIFELWVGLKARWFEKSGFEVREGTMGTPFSFLFD